MRKYLRHDELLSLIAHAREQGRHGLRDGLLLLMMYRHGFRVSEIIDLRWSDIDFESGTVLCRRLKSGIDSLHPLSSEELQQLTQLPKHSHGAPYVFLSERGSKLHRQRVNEIVRRASHGLDIEVTPHTLRHSTCAALVRGRLPIRNIQAFVGHASIGSTLVYAHLDETRFVGAAEALT